MKRADLTWALGAVLPHVGTTKGKYVGMEEREGQLYVYATDAYTAGIARIPGTFAQYRHYDLSKSEAQDLMRFVRPTKKAHDTEELDVVDYVGRELHVATAEDSAVFDLVSDNPVTLDLLLGLVERLVRLPVLMTSIVQQPSLPAKFAKAQRYETDRLCLYPFAPYKRHPDSIQPRYGVAAVTVGKHFVGTVAGLTHEPPLDLGVIESFLNEARGSREVRTP